MSNNRLKIMRMVTGYKQVQLARLVNVAQSTYSAWETGTKNIHAENIKKLADIYNVSLDFLSGRGFYMTRPVECWSQSEQEEYYTSNEYKRAYLEYLWGAPVFSDDTSRASTENAKILANPHAVSSLNEHEMRVLTAYRSLPHLQVAVDRLLGVDQPAEYTVYEAAKSSDNHPPRLVRKAQEEWDIISNAPETDEPLK